MHSLSELNNYSQTELTYSDQRPTQLIYNNTETINRSITVNEDETHQLPLGIDIREFVNVSPSQMVYQVNVSSLSGATVTWASLPANVTVTSSAGVYSVIGVNKLSQWTAIKQPTVTMPADHKTNWSYTASILLNSVAVKTWTVAVAVVEIVDLSQPSTHFYTTGVLEKIQHTPQIQDTGSSSYTLVISNPNTAFIDTLETTITNSASVTVNGTTKAITIVGSRTDINQHLNNLRYKSTVIDSDWLLTYTLTNGATSLVTVQQQAISSISTYLMSRGSAHYYDEDIPSIVTNTPLITDEFGNVGEVYTLNINSASANAVANLSAVTSANVSYNSDSDTLTLVGTKDQINSGLGNLTLTTGVDYNDNFQLNYELTSSSILYDIKDAYFGNLGLIVSALNSSTGNIVDSSPNGYTPGPTIRVDDFGPNATFQSYTLPQVANTNSALGNIPPAFGNTAIKFSGTNEIAYPAEINLQPENDWTLEALVMWPGQFSTNQYSTSGRIFEFYSPSSGFSFVTIGAQGIGDPTVNSGAGVGRATMFVTASNGTNSYIPQSGIEFNAYDQWLHIVLAKNGSLMKVSIAPLGSSGYMTSTISVNNLWPEDDFAGSTTYTQNLRLVIGSGMRGYMDQIRFTRANRYPSGTVPAVTDRWPLIEKTPIPTVATYVNRLQDILIDRVDSDTVSNIKQNRTFTANKVDLLFSENVPQIIDNQPSGTEYTIEFSAGHGRFGLSDLQVNSTYIFTGSEVACNNVLTSLKFYPNKDTLGNYVFTYKHYKNSVLQFTQLISHTGLTNTNPIQGSGMISIGSTSTFTPSYEQANYLNLEYAVVGGGGGGTIIPGEIGGADSGGGGGHVITGIYTGSLVTGSSYNAVIGLGGRGATLTQSATSGSTSSFLGITAPGGEAAPVTSRGGNSMFAGGSWNNYRGGGGGGAGAVGGNATIEFPGAGGAGKLAISNYYGGGGGGGGVTTPGGSGGLGGGGRGANGIGSGSQTTNRAQPGVANTGGGGGGGNNYWRAAAGGGSGVVVLRFY